MKSGEFGVDRWCKVLSFEVFCFVLSVGGVRGVKLSVWGVCVRCLVCFVSVER